MASKALFLDRDGVINLDHGYASRPDQIDFIEDIFGLCERFQKQGYLIFIVTNQSGIGRGFYSEQDFHNLSQWMIAEFKQRGIQLTDVFYCPHHPSAGKGKYLQVCNCRKPNPGMFEQANKKYDIDMSKSFMIGDNKTDMQAAAKAGVANRFLYSTTTLPDDTQIGFHYIDTFAQVRPQ